MNVIAINGSPHENGNTAALLNLALAEISAQGIETRLLNLGTRPVRGCTACFGCFKNKNGRCALDDGPINDYLALMAKADGILLGSPTYFADLTAGMKAVIERCGMVARANPGLLTRKAGAAVVAVRRGGAMHVFHSINSFFLIGEMIVVGSSYWNIGVGREPGEVNNDAEGVATMKTLGRNMAWLLKKLH